MPTPDHDHHKCCKYLLCAHPKCCGYYGQAFRGIHSKTLDQIAQNSGTSRIMEHIQAAMYPFRPTEIVIRDEYDIDFNAYDLSIEIRNLPYFEYVGRMDRDTLLDFGDMNAVSDMIGAGAARYFLSIPRVPPEDNIELGEN